MLAPRDNHLDKSWTLVFQLLHGRLTLDDIAKQIADAALPALQARVDGLLRQLSFHDEQDNEARLRRLFRDLAHDGRGLVDFTVFERLLGSELAGIVFTAHPTFSLSEGANEIALELMRLGSVGTRANGAHAQPRRVTVHRASAPTLQQEADASMVAIRHLRKAMRRMLRVAVEIAAELYPDDYRRLVPRFFTAATWVGFDLDGRTDIGWNRSLSCRYQIALAGLEELHEGLRDMRERHADATTEVAEAFDAIARALGALSECFQMGVEALGREADDTVRLGRLNRLALEKRALKQDAIGAIDAALAALLEFELTPIQCRDLLVFRAEWLGLGLGLARLHFRLNSVQLHNAIRPDIALDAAPGESPTRRHFLAAVTSLLDNVTPVNVHYGTVAREQTTAKRVFMLAAQFQKHFDARTPVRMLVAESDTPFTLLAALYYARLFGVESPSRDLAAVRDRGRHASRRPRDRRAARQPAFPRLCAAPRPILRPARLLRLGPLHRPTGRHTRDRALQAPADPALGSARAPGRAAIVLRHARRIDWPRRASAQPRGSVPVHAFERGPPALERARDAA